MLWWLIPLILFCASAIVILSVAVRKIPQARVIDVTNIPSERSRLIKEQILLGRIKRIYVSKLLKAKEISKPQARKLQTLVRKAVNHGVRLILGRHLPYTPGDALPSASARPLILLRTILVTSPQIQAQHQ